MTQKFLSTVSRTILSILTILVSSLSVHAAESPAVTLQKTDGKQLSGRYVSFDGKQVAIDNGAKTVVPVASILRIDFADATSAGASLPMVYLANNDRIAVSPTKMDGDNLYGVWNALPKKPTVAVPLLSIRGVLFSRSIKESQRPERVILDHQLKSDLVVLKNGDRVTGTLKSLDDKSVSITGAAAAIDRKAVHAVAFDPRYIQTAKLIGPRVLVRLTDGSLFTAKSFGMKSDGVFAVTTGFGAKIDIPITAVRSLQFLGGTVIPLSQVPPTTFEYTPYLDGKRPLQKNANVLGGPLTLRGREYAIGLGMHTRSRVTYELSGEDQTFLATIGVDDAADGKGSVVFQVQADGKTLFKSPVLTGKSKPLPIGPISLKGHKRLTLVVDFGPYGDLLDYADWCDAVLVKRRN